MPEFAPRTVMRALAEPYTFGSRVPNSVAPESTHKVTPVGIEMGPVMKLSNAPLGASLSE